MRGNRILVALATAGLAALVFSGVAGAETLPGCPTSQSTPSCDVLPNSDQLGETVTAPSAGPELALTEQPAATSTGPSGTLPFTGADVVELSVVGLGAIGVGTIMVRRSRARRVES